MKTYNILNHLEDTVKKVTGTVADVEQQIMELKDYHGHYMEYTYEEEPQRGVLVDIFESKSSGNCSADGISNRFDTVLLIGDNVPKILKANGKPVVKIENHYKDAYRAYEVDADGKELKKQGFRGPMHGGCMIHTSDSRFPLGFAVKLHDRFELY